MLANNFTEEERLRAVRIFMYEGSGRSSLYWTSPHLYFEQMRQPSALAELYTRAYNEWSTTKRGFQREELVEGVWIKIGDDGNTAVIRLLSGGRLEEASLFKPQRCGQGSWLLERGLLRMNLGEYECDVFASCEGSIHSGIEFVRGQNEPTACVKLIHQEKMMKRNLLYNPDDMVYEGVTSLGRRLAVSSGAFLQAERNSSKRNTFLSIEAYDPDWWEAQMPDEHIWYVEV
jgi:hypothetical protein